MKIKNKFIIDKNFIDAFASLMTISMPAKQCLEVSATIDEFTNQYQIIIRARKAIADKYCKKDEDGKAMGDENDNIIFESEELKTKCFEEIKEILEEEIDVTLSSKIKIKKTESMTPLKVKLLKDIIEITE